MNLVDIFIPVNKTNENITQSNNWKSFLIYQSTKHQKF